MSDPISGTGSPVGLPSQQLNVTTGSTVHFQHVLSTGSQNLNLLAANGQQFLITSPVSVSYVNRVVPTISTSASSVQQTGVTRFVNISQAPQAQRVVNRGSLQLSNTDNDGRVSIVSINPTTAAGQVRSAAHPTLVTSLASPVRQPQRTNSAVSPSAIVLTSSNQANYIVQTNLTRKRPKLYEDLDNNFFNDENGPAKRRILDNNSVKLNQFLTKYAECVAELFFLEADGNIIDFPTWKSKRQNTQQFQNFLLSNKLDLDDEEEDLSSALALPDHEAETKQAVPSTAATSLNPNATQVQAQQQQQQQPQQQQRSDGNMASRVPNPEKRSPVKQLNKLMLNPLARQHTRQHSISAVYESSLGSQEQIVEKAKQEAYVVQRVSELQREGLWSEKRLPKVQEPPRNKAHWDYLLEEMVWLAADFAQERKWKKANAKKCAKMVQKYFQDKAVMQKREEKSQELKLRKLANFMAKEVKNFWANVNKLVEYKQTTRLEEKRKKALDQHLSFIVDQTEKYSSWLAESMNKGGIDNSNKTSTNCSRVTSPVQKSSGSDDDFEPNTCSEDDEETIAKEEGETGQHNNSDEIERLKQESELPLEDLLKDLPEDYWNNRDKIDPGGNNNSVETHSNKSEDFTIDLENETSDDEETLEEQEKAEGKMDHSKELAELEADNNMDIEELLAKYGRSTAEDNDEKEDVSSTSESLSDSSEDEVDDEDVDVDEEENDEDEDEDDDEEVDLKVLIDDQSDKTGNGSHEKANKEINDVAAIAESLQPTGNTLLTTSVVTPIPFLLKHVLREYQHIGLDWLVTMFERKLNGILADEMGLGKTIQTIALLSHLACEKGNWGPHLIIVPTSVMLNWEMELKKWCPAFKILTYYGTQKERKHKRAGWTKPNAFHVCITSYKLVIQDHQSFRRKKWKYLVLDEAQNIKNFKSQRWQLLLNFQTQRRLLLTGTPLQNNLMELWSLMHFLMPNVFQSHREFKEWFSNPVTGMIEGNSEYNENIIKRLHKVLRPFLLRRLKTEVEKQLPKKYEHVVMCRLSKRQRYLYDDFMSRAKTKETLASGNLLSVINVLMQLRKVCNHPNLFEVRPIISPFQMEGLVYYVASLVSKALEYDVYRHVDLSFLNLVFVNLERMTAYVSYRVKKIKTSKKLIEEIDTAPEDPPRCPPSKIKITVRNIEKKVYVNPVTTDSKSLLLSALPPAKVGTSPIIKSFPVSGASQGLSLKLSGSQIQLVPNQNDGKAVTTQSESLQRGVSVQLVQTSTGRHIYFPLQSQAGGSTVIAGNGQRLTPSKNSSADVKLVNSNFNNNSNNYNIAKPMNWIPTVNIQAIQGSAVVGTTTVTTTTAVTTTRTSSAISHPLSSPIIQSLSHISGDFTTTSQQPDCVLKKIDLKEEVVERKFDNGDICEETERDFDIFGLPHIEEKLKARRKGKLELIGNINDYRCEAYPLYGSDLIAAVRVIDSVDAITNNWLCSGFTHCQNVHKSYNVFWCQTQYLNSIVKKPEDIARDLHSVLKRFVFYVPSVAAPHLQMHVSHPSPSAHWEEKLLEMVLRKELSPRCDLLHSIASSMCTQFPDPRLIQYDCGKLQVLDKLLRKLKVNHHKVLLFTQMTRMLDILEAFLNYHGHKYLRLDGTTKVDQRQVLMERFNGDSRIFCFILSTRSGGIGVNLTGADTVIFYDSDWNPTMDAQAQDRCHRIGQTRDVHIYRLISEMTVEENILKKANQKRLLGDLAIEGGNFTTAYFKSSTIQDLFNVDVSETDAKRRMADVLGSDKDKRTSETVENDHIFHPDDKAALGVLESALAAAEDETDVQAARTAKAEAAAELAEFDENIPIDDESTHAEEPSKAEMEVNNLVEQLTPIERYAMRFVEENEAAWSAEQLAAAEAQIEQQKREWELGRLQALKAEEERRMQEEELDEDLLTYSREDSTNQVWLDRRTMEQMPMWCPPTPPQEDNDVYLDQTMCFLYESQTMSDTQLPPVYVKKELKRVRSADTSPGIEGRRAIKIHRKEDSPGSAPRSLFDHPSSALQKMRRDMKMQKYRGLVRPSIQIPGQKPPIASKPLSDSENLPEWTIHEDWALLQSIEKLQELPLNLIVLKPGHTPNWDMVADMVNMVSCIYRSPSHCRIRYETVIIPREEGKLLQDSKKQKKTKSVYKMPVTKSSRPVRTCQLYMQDNNASFTDVYHQKFDNIKVLSYKRSPTLKQVLVNPTMKNPKHADVLTDSGIAYEAPVNPIEIATRRAERIAKEKQKSMQALQASAQTNTVQTLNSEQLAQQQLLQQRQITTAASTAKSVAAASASTNTVNIGIPLAAAVAANSPVIQTVTTSPSSSTPSSQSIVIASAQQISSVVPTASITTLSPGLRQSRPIATIPVGIQEMVVASTSMQPRSASNTPVTAVVSVAQIQAARIASGSLVTATSIPATMTSVKGTTVPAVTVASGKALNPAQIQYYRQQAILRQQQQRLTMREQQLKVIQGQQSTIGQAGVAIGQQKVASVATVSGVTAVQPVSPSQQKAQFLKQTANVIAKGRQEEMAALMKQQIQRQQKTAVAVTQQPPLTAQILAQAGLSVQTGSPGQAPVATLVKTSTGGQSVTIPMTGIAIPQVKTAINPQLKTTPGSTQPIRQLGLNYQQLLAKQGRGQATKVTQIAKPGLQTQLIVQSQGGKAVSAISMQHIQQVIKNVQPQHITVSAGQPVLQQGNQVVLGKSPQVNTSGVQTRVIPVNGTQGASRQTIQVVPGAAIRAVPNVTIDTSGRSQVNVSSTLASALTGSIKVAQSTSSQQAFISQVAATLPGIVRQTGVNPVRIQTSSSSGGTPLMAVAVQQQQIRTNSQTQPDNSQNQS